MTRKQIDALKETAEYGTELYEELSCREMINSILIYGNINSADEGGYSHERYVKPFYTGKHQFYNKKPLLTKERVLELIEEQKADFAKAVVRANTYTDGEGCTYNSCRWEDEI
jgi:hypothetical protein